MVISPRSAGNRGDGTAGGSGGILPFLWLVDDLLSPPGASLWRGGEPGTMDEQRGTWECWSLLTALAVAVPDVELGTLVLNTTFRNPALIAKMADTVDEISGGRVILGIGAGDARYEHHAFGYPFDQRVSRFAEAVTIIDDLLHKGASDLRGAHYQVHDCALLPRGPRREGPPILIGSLADGPRMLRLVVAHADIWNGWLVHSRSTPRCGTAIARGDRRGLLTEGRDHATLARTVAIRIALLGQAAPTGEAIQGTPEAIANASRAHAAAGISHVQVWLTPDTMAGVAAFAPVLESLDRG